MPIAKMRVSNCPTRAAIQGPANRTSDENPFADVRTPSAPSAISQDSDWSTASPSTVRRISRIMAIAADLLNLNSGQAALLRTAAVACAASRHRAVLGGKVQITTTSPESACQLLPSLGFQRVIDGWRLTNPRFQKRVEIGDGMTTRAKAEVDGPRVIITIDRNWKLI